MTERRLLHRKAGIGQPDRRAKDNGAPDGGRRNSGGPDGAEAAHGLEKPGRLSLFQFRSWFQIPESDFGKPDTESHQDQVSGQIDEAIGSMDQLRDDGSEERQGEQSFHNTNHVTHARFPFKSSWRA